MRITIEPLPGAGMKTKNEYCRGVSPLAGLMFVVASAFGASEYEQNLGESFPATPGGRRPDSAHHFNSMGQERVGVAVHR